MKEKLDNLFTRTESFSDPDTKMSLPEVLIVGSKISFDFLSETIYVEEAAFASAEARDAGASAIKSPSSTYVIQGDQLAELIKAKAKMFLDLGDLFGFALQHRTEAEAKAKETENSLQRQKMEAAREAIEAVGGKVIFPEDAEGGLK